MSMSDVYRGQSDWSMRQSSGSAPMDSRHMYGSDWSSNGTYNGSQSAYYSVSEHWGQIVSASGIGRRTPAAVEQNNYQQSTAASNYGAYRSSSDSVRSYSNQSVRRSDFPQQNTIRRDVEQVTRYNDRWDYDTRRPSESRFNDPPRQQRPTWQDDSRRRDFYRHEPDSPGFDFVPGFDDPVKPSRVEERISAPRALRKQPKNVIDPSDDEKQPPQRTEPAPAPAPAPVSPPAPVKRTPKFMPFSAAVRPKEEEQKPLDPVEAKAEEFLKRHFTPACDPVIDPFVPKFEPAIAPHVISAIRASPEFLAAFVPLGWEDPPERLTNEICQYTLSEYGDPGVPFSDFIISDKEDYFFYAADPFSGSRVPTEEEKYLKLIRKYNVEDGRELTEKRRSKPRRL